MRAPVCDRTVLLYLPDALVETLQEMAANAGLRLSPFIRNQLTKMVGENLTDPKSM